MSRVTKTAVRWAVYAETTATTPDGRTTVTRTALEDDGHLRTFDSPEAAVHGWEESIRASGSEAREFAREGASRFYEVIMPGAERSILYHVRIRRVAG